MKSKDKKNIIITPNQSTLKTKLSSENVENSFYENIVDTVREPLLILDKDLRVVKASKSFLNYFKVSSLNTIGKLIYDLGNKEWDIPKLRELLESILPEKAVFDNFVVEHDFSTIGKRFMLLNARQIERAFSKEKIILLAIEDITERKKIEAGLEKTRKELAIIKISADEASEFSENLINTVHESLIVLDKELRIVKAGRSFYDFFKVSSDETIGKLIYDLGNKQWNIPKLKELLETILPEKTTFENYEVEHDFPTIGKRVMLLNARQIERAFSKEKVILLAIEDITKRKYAEDQLQKSLKDITKINAEKDKFFSIIAHDLRSPFNGFIGLTGLMADNTENFSQSEFVEHSRYINNSAKKLYELLEYLLEWSQIQNGAIVYTPMNLELSKLVSDSIETIYERVKQKRIEIINEIDNSQYVYADGKMIGSVLRNLLSNAVKFTNTNGKICIKTEQTSDGKVQVSIEDNGVGIPEKDIGKLFKIEEKVSTKGTDGESSVGLGLLLCKEFIDLHGEKIWAENNKITGSKFSFTLLGSKNYEIKKQKKYNNT